MACAQPSFQSFVLDNAVPDELEQLQMSVDSALWCFAWKHYVNALFVGFLERKLLPSSFFSDRNEHDPNALRTPIMIRHKHRTKCISGRLRHDSESRTQEVHFTAWKMFCTKLKCIFAEIGRYRNFQRGHTLQDECVAMAGLVTLPWVCVKND